MLKKIEMKPVFLLNGLSIKLPIEPKPILLLFLAFSFGICGIDVLVAHSQNHFIPTYEWIPVIYSPLAALVVVFYMLRESNSAQNVYKGTMLAGMVMGIVGALFHVFANMTLNQSQPISWLIFGTPIFAPIAFTGMSLYGLALINASIRTLIRLVALGFLVIALTAAFDHAQTHFENIYTYFPIVAGFLAFMIAWLCAGQEKMSLPVANLFYAVMLMMIFEGVLGFSLHVMANLEGTVFFAWSRMLYKAPVLAPLLFAQLGTLGIISSLSLQAETSLEQSQVEV